MKAAVNQQLFAQTVLDSGALAMLGAVIHRFSEPGDYHGTVLKGEEIATTFRLTVEEESGATQVDVDLAAQGRPRPRAGTSPCECTHEDRKETAAEVAQHYTINPSGHAVFYVSRGQGEYAVLVNRLNEERILFDSRELQDGDLFAATLIRPGAYSVTNAPAGAKGRVIVAYPDVTRGLRPAEPAVIDVGKDGLIDASRGKATKLDKLQLQVGQGQVYRIRTTSRIRLELVEPDDGPKQNGPAAVLSWRKPRVPPRKDPDQRERPPRKDSGQRERPPRPRDGER